MSRLVNPLFFDDLTSETSEVSIVFFYNDKDIKNQKPFICGDENREDAMVKHLINNTSDLLAIKSDISFIN